MSPLQIVSLIALWSLIAGIGLWSWRVWSSRQLVRRRLAALSDQEVEQQLTTELKSGRIGGWLFRAGYRAGSAPQIFFTLSGLGLALGGAFVATIYLSGISELFEQLLRLLPGGVGEVFLPIAWGSPWFGGLLLAFIPAAVVHTTRQRRIQSVEQDLPLTLDLLATLAEAGLGFDSALDRILETQGSDRPLAEDLRLFQIDILAGRQRVEALRRLMQRVDVAWFSIFVSAVIHAEQVGSGLAQTLRTQADDLRMRRRERALALAMAVPVKLLFPLIICFLPGIMTAALGPVVFQIVQVLDSFLKGSLGQ